MNLDTLKAVSIGSGGVLFQFLDFVPDLVKIGVGLVTIAYWMFKIKKEFL